jgi:signal transduction histidine kinase
MMDNPLLSLQMDVKEFLRPLLLGLAEEDLDELAQAAVVRSFPAGTVICQEGEPGDAVYTIVQGQVEILKQLDDERERHLRDTEPGELFGEMAIIQEGTRTATVRTTEPTTILEIGQEPFLRVLGRSPSLAIRILTRLTDRLRDADQHSIADLRRANERLTRALEKLERLDKIKSDFIQVVAHELRTPVAVLLGYVQMIQNSPAVQEDPQMWELIDGMVESMKRLHRIFASILDVSRVVTEEVQIYHTPVSIPAILKGIVLEFEQALKERNIVLEQEGLYDLPLCPGDPELLFKAFYHLVNNAIKYTPDGGRIKVAVRKVEVPDLGQCIEVAVEDTGVGIAPKDLDLIFEKFYRTGEMALHSSGKTTFKGGGPGLGLTIAQGVILAHGGRIWAESPGYDEETCPGSRFVVQLPLTQRARESEEKAPAP